MRLQVQKPALVKRSHHCIPWSWESVGHYNSRLKKGYDIKITISGVPGTKSIVWLWLAHVYYMHIFIWLVVWTHLKKNSQLGLWHSQYMESHKIHVPNHQPVSYIYISHRIHVWYIYANMDPSWVYEVFSKIFPDSVKHGQTSPASSVRHFESVPKLLWSSHRERCKMVQENNRERKRPDDVSLGCVEKYLAPHNCANLALYKLQERHISPHIYRLYRTLPSNKI